MDKRYYYSILGLREGASTADIKNAYERHMRRLALPDYADDPEYVARKKDQIRHAYNVLVGGAQPVTKSQKEARFQKWKDAEDAGEDAIEDIKRAFKRHTRSCEPATELSAGLAQLKDKFEEVTEGFRAAMPVDNGHSERIGKRKTIYLSPEEKQRHDENNRQSKVIKIVLACIIGFSMFSSLITACGSMIVNVADDIASETEFGGTSEYAVEVAADQAEEIIG